MSTTEQVLPAEQPSALRRFLAFVTDLVIIGVPAGAVGALLFDPLSDLGDYGRLIGAVLIALYFGYFDSRLGGGTSPGKGAVGLEVVGTTGASISPARAAARALIVSTPILVPSPVGDNVVLQAIAGLLIYALGLSLAYLAILNRPSRRSVHDLATASMVVCRGARLAPLLPMRRVHWAIVAILAVWAVADPVLSFEADDPSDGVDETASVRRRVESLPEARSAKVTQDGRSKEVVAAVRFRHRLTDKTAAANAVAAAIYRGPKKPIAGAPVTVVLVRGFKLGVANIEVREKCRVAFAGHQSDCGRGYAIELGGAQ